MNRIMTKLKRIAIIGSGPAGLTAAIYTSRAELDTTVYLGNQPGGQLTTTTEIENFPGFIDGIMGPELMSNMQKQAERFGTKTGFSSVKSIAPKGSQFMVTANDNTSEEFDSVIIASGASAKYLGIPGEEKYIGKGYHSCATCDGFFYKDKIIGIVGGGDSAAEEATFLTKFGSKVIVFVRKDALRASKIMQTRMLENPKIEIMFNTQVVGMMGEPFVEKILIKDTNTGEEKEIAMDGLFVAIGHTPNNQFVKDLITMDEVGYLIPQSRLPQEERTSKYSMMSNINGIFLAGDIEDSYYRQAITAAGDGCRAAIECEKWLEDQE
jgi:thioredoxin reductase (NADPH)